MARCEGTTKKGKPCNGGAVPGTRLCGPHQGQPIQARKEMLVAVLNRPDLTAPVYLGPFETVEQIVEMCDRLRIGVGIAEVVDPAIFDNDRDRLWVYGTRHDYGAD